MTPALSPGSPDPTRLVGLSHFMMEYVAVTLSLNLHVHASRYIVWQRMTSLFCCTGVQCGAMQQDVHRAPCSFEDQRLFAATVSDLTFCAVIFVPVIVPQVPISF